VERGVLADDGLEGLMGIGFGFESLVGIGNDFSGFD
jgi:hypothetical protein